jgi:hypothetical protein
MRLRYPRLLIALVLLALLAAMLSSAAYTPTQAQSLPAGDGGGGSGGGFGQGAPQQSAIGTTAFFPVPLIETFENSWPSSGWTLYDLGDNDGGEYLWGRRNCNPHSGSYAVWSGGGGNQGSQLSCLSSLYPNNMTTHAVYGPFDLSDVLAATVTYHIYGSTEWDGTNDCPYDRFTIRAYTDAGAYYYYYHCGNWTNGGNGNGYYQRSFVLDGLTGPGQGNAWLSLEFTSDSSIGDIGMLVDDVTLSVVRPTPTATSTPTRTPTFTPTRTPTSTPTGSPVTPTATQIGAPTATHTNTPTATHTNTPINTPTNTIGPLTPQPVYLPLTLSAPLPTPFVPPTVACPDDIEPNNIPEDGKRLTTINSSCIGSFQNERAPIFDYYWVQPTQNQQLVVDLTAIPTGANYDIALYRQDPGNNYPRLAVSNKPGAAPEHFEANLEANRRYFVRVSLITKSVGAKDTYTLTVATK